MPEETGPARRLWVTADVISISPWGHTWGQTLLSPLRQPLNSKFRSAALDNLSPHWSWQYECGHGAKWYFREWDCTPSLVLLHTRLPATPVSMGLFQLQDMRFEDPFDVAQFFWHQYNIPNLAQWEWTWNCRVLKKNYERIRHNWCYWSSVKRNSRAFLALYWVYFLPKAANAKPQSHLSFGTFCWKLCVLLVLCQWLP